MVCALASGAWAQRAPKASRPAAETSANQVRQTASSRLLSSDEGLAIIGAALETRYGKQPYGDCSHLVHTIYQQAGFRYAYAASSQIYDGIDAFRQVSHPQPGDLAVWRGHAAIVVNPAQHSFFSATRSGLRVESYDWEYWKRRGPPRFFRYVKPASSNATSVSRTGTAKVAALRNVESRTPITAAGDSGELDTDDPAPSTIVPVDDLPRILVVHTPQPKAKQVDEALSQFSARADKTLLDQDVLKLSQPLVVFDYIEIKGVHLKGNQGWAEVKIAGISSLADGRATAKKRSEQQRWVLTRRDASTWELLLPLKPAYVPRDVAVRSLAHQLAALADRTPEAGDSSKDQAQLARTLSLLLEKEK